MSTLTLRSPAKGTGSHEPGSPSSRTALVELPLAAAAIWFAVRLIGRSR